MREVGHLAGGYLVTRQLVEQWQLSEEEKNKLLALGTAAATLPDVDVLLYVLKTRSLELGSDFDHHKWVTHTFPFYVVPGFLVYLYARLVGRAAWRRRAVVVTVAAATHLLQDTIGSGTGLMWAWPFSRRMDGIVVLNVTGKAWREAYRQHPVSWIERLLVVAAAFTFLSDLSPK
ncbi:MAG TPA: metal-dependent hydrolase [Anaerolineae bacterium]